MKYLIQHTKELVISLGVFATVILAILWAVFSIVKGTFSYENLIALIGVVFELLGWYFNIPTSETNAKYTGMMRLEKDQLAGKINGENFYDEIEDGGEMEEEFDEEFQKDEGEE